MPVSLFSFVPGVFPPIGAVRFRFASPVPAEGLAGTGYVCIRVGVAEGSSDGFFPVAPLAFFYHVAVVIVFVVHGRR